jgi:hypothetical protein
MSVVDAATVDQQPDHLGDAIRTLADQVQGVRGPVLVGSQANAELVFGGHDIGKEVIVLALEKRGIETVVEESEADHFGPHRAQPERAVTSVCLRAVDQGGVDPLPTSLRTERNRLLGELGLSSHATASDIFVLAEADPSRRDLIAQLVRIPDLPRLELQLEACSG